MEVSIHCPLDEEFGYKERRELAFCLDPIAPMFNDWRLLMHEMGFPYKFKHYLECEKSPTMALLEAWARKEGSKATVTLLREYISKLDPPRSDAVFIVQEHLKLQMDNPSPRLSPYSVLSHSSQSRSPHISMKGESLNDNEIQNYDIYLSASQDKEDQEFAEEIYQKLQKEKFTVFFSGHHNMIGRPFSESVVKMIREKCTKTLIILSESYNKSESCTYEARMAHMKSLDARNHVLVPVMYKKCKAPDFISHLFYLDFERYKDRPPEDFQEYFWNRLYRSLRYNPQSENKKRKEASSSSKKFTKSVLSHQPKFFLFKLLPL